MSLYYIRLFGVYIGRAQHVGLRDDYLRAVSSSEIHFWPICGLSESNIQLLVDGIIGEGTESRRF